MKQVAILFLCGLVHLCTAQNEIDKDHCFVDHASNLAKLEEMSRQMNGLISTMKKEISCEKEGRALNPVASCRDVPLTSSSGEYWIRPRCGSPFRAWCDLSRRYDGTNKGWMRVANLNMNDSNHWCPTGWRTVTRTSEPRRTCGRTRSVGCESMVFPVNGTEYSRVCGRVRAYQYASPDAWFRYDNSRSIDSHYVDGVSITHGWRYRRTHIWTFAASWTDTNSNNGCPCAASNWQGRMPSFVGNHYFCETGHRNEWASTFYPDVLWDGEGCDGTRSTCCVWNNPPWFCRDLPRPTTEDIELRLCGDQGPSDEDTPIEAVEIWVH